MKRKMKYCMIVAFIVIVACVLKSNPSSQVTLTEGVQYKTLKLIAPYESAESKKMLTGIVQAYELKKQDVKIEIDFVPSEDYLKRLMLKYFNDSPPDLIIIDSYDTGYLSQEGLLCDVSDEIKTLTPDKESGGSFYPVLLDSNYIHKLCYAVPFTCSAYALYINRSLLDDLHIPIPESWEDIDTASRKIIGSGPYGFAMAARQHEELTAQFFALFFTAGGTLDKMNSDDGLQAFSLLEKMSKDNTLTLNVINWSQRDLTIQFCNEQIAMMLNDSTQIPTIRNKNPKFEWSVIPIPFFAEKPDVIRNLISSESIAVTNKDNYEDSMDFIRFISSADIQKRVALAYGGIPVREGLIASCQESKAGIGDVFYSQIEDTAVIGPYRLWPYISQSIQDEIFDLLTQTNDARQGADMTQTKVRAYRLKN